MLDFLSNHKIAISITAFVLATAGIFFLSTSDIKNNLRDNILLDGNYYLKDSQQVSANESTHGFDSDGDLHLRLQPNKALEMTKQQHIFKACGQKQKRGCPEKTWQTYAYLDRSTKQGDMTIYNHKLAVPQLDNIDKQRVVCTFHEASIDTGYGICVDPKTSDLWYHYYAY